jgi:hypothetical protein
MTDEKLQTLNAMKEKIDELGRILVDLECADCPAIMNCDWDTGNHDLILDLRDFRPLLDAVKTYLQKDYERRVQKFEEA